MKECYGPNKSNGLIIQARVIKSLSNMLIYIGKTKRTPKHQRKAKRQGYKHVSSMVVKKFDYIWYLLRR